MLSRALARVWSLAIWFQEPRSGETTIATGASPWMGISTSSQPRAKRKLDRAQPQEEGRHKSCAAPLLEAALYRACASRGASAECQSKTTGSRPWLKLYRRSAAKMANLQEPRSGYLNQMANLQAPATEGVVDVP